MLEEHIRNISKEIEAFKRSQKDDPIKSFSDPIKRKLYQAILQDNSLNYAAYGAIIGVSEATVKRRLNEMKREGLILRVGSNKTGHWEIVKGKGDEE